MKAEKTAEQPQPQPAKQDEAKPTEKKDNLVVENAVRAFTHLTQASNVFEVYASYGILCGKMMEFAVAMINNKNQTKPGNNENSVSEGEGPESPEVG